MLRDLVTARILPIEAQVGEIHCLLVGTPKPGLKPLVTSRDGRIGGMGMAFHDMISKLAVIAGNAEALAMKQEDLPKLVAQELANGVLKLFQSEITDLKSADASHVQSIELIRERLDRIDPPVAMVNGEDHD